MDPTRCGAVLARPVGIDEHTASSPSADKALATLGGGMGRTGRGPRLPDDRPRLQPPLSAIRRPVVTRKNAHGSRNDEGARLAARVGACDRNGGRPPPGPDLERLLACSSRRPLRLGTAAGPPRINHTETATETASPEYGHAARWHAQSRGFRILTSS
jgi:hypothetical protein